MDPNILEPLMNLPYFPYVATAITIASVIANVIPKPAEKSKTWNVIYQIVNILALNLRKK